MNIISFNINLKMDNSLKVANFLKKISPDIICLQEAVRGLDKNVFKKYESVSVIDKKLEQLYPYKFFGPQWISKGVIKPNGQYRDYGGYIEQGNYTMSKYPILDAKNIHYYKCYELQMDHRNFYKEDHPRSIAVVDLLINDKVVTVFNIHGCFSKDKRDTFRSLAQSKFLIEKTSRVKNALIIIGDFNVTPQTRSVLMLEKKFANIMNKFNISFTQPIMNHGVIKKNKTVDYIFTNNKIKPKKFETIDTKISDHLPLLFEFSL